MTIIKQFKLDEVQCLLVIKCDMMRIFPSFMCFPHAQKQVSHVFGISSYIKQRRFCASNPNLGSYFLQTKERDAKLESGLSFF